MNTAPCHDGREAYLEQLFQCQVEILLKTDMPSLAGMNESAFLNLVEPLHEMIWDIDPLGYSLPFMIVVTSRLVSSIVQCAKIYQGRRGETTLDSQLISTTRSGSTPRHCYLVTQVDDGRRCGCLTATDFEEHARRQGRTPFNIEEGLALARYCPEILGTHDLCVANMRYGREADRMIYIGLNEQSVLLEAERPSEMTSEYYSFPSFFSRRYITAEPSHPWDGPT